MPYKPKTPCKHPGCPRLSHNRFCDSHAKQDAQEYERYRRDPAHSKRYGTQWRKIRARYIKANPLCELCLQAGRYTPTQEIHHRKPLAEGGANNTANLQALCKACHSSIHLSERNRHG